MDEATIASLEAALAATPDNVALRLVIVRAALALGQPARAHALLAGRAPDELREPADRRLAAAACLAAGDAAGALRYVDDDAPESLVVRARALLALGRLDEGRAAYDRAVGAQAALEDPELRALLAARVHVFPAGPTGEGGDRRLRVYTGAGGGDAKELDALLAPEARRVTFADVGGLGEVKEQIRRRILLPFQKPTLFQRFRKRVGGGILLYGPPGCGKTLLARATAGESGAAFFNVAISDVLDMWFGESEAKLHALFDKARASVPAVLFFDEVEALGGKRQHSHDATTAKLVSQFLSEMDGFAQNNQGVLVIGATNVPWAVDAAFRRPGRFDRFLFIPPPDRAAREAILALHLADRPVEGKIDLAWLAERTTGFSGADIKNLVETAADEAIEATIAAATEVPIGDRHLREALRQVKPTTLEWLTTARNHARYANEGGQYDDVLAFLERNRK